MRRFMQPRCHVEWMLRAGPKNLLVGFVALPFFLFDNTLCILCTLKERKTAGLRPPLGLARVWG